VIKMRAPHLIVSMLIDVDTDAKRNDWISLDLMQCVLLDGNLGLVFLVDLATEDILHDAIIEWSPDGVIWVILSQSS
jgi:hypothetical protein